MNNPLTNGDYLDWCLRQEVFAEQLYEELARRPEVVEADRALLRQLAAQERDHITSLQFVQRLLRLAQELEIAFNLSAEQRQLLAACERETAGVKPAELSLTQGYALAYRMEERFVEVHGLLEQTSSNKELARLFRQLRTGDQEHFAALARLRDRHVGSATAEAGPA
ncbi:ferritin family protein [Desulfuromonas thiophila]|uniref:ferritin family protein n=1 Tax=Desulfuromonas thiophila TaxID=57664 RepID=UPI0029F52879|nr:ferritin family protein [Desulfuromonas thiophila]